LPDSEPIPGPSQQTENTQQEALQAWLLKIHNQLRFLSQIEHSISFANLISSLDKELQPEASEKNSIEFLLALDDFIEKEKNPSLSIQFFIQKILKSFRFLIDNYRDTYAKLISLEETINQSSLTEDSKQLQIALLDLIKEKKQLQKSLLPDFELTRLIELTNDLEKFRFEYDRDFMHEIAIHEANLKSFTQELDQINEKIENIEEELIFPIDQLETYLKINQRKLSHLQVDLYSLKQIRTDNIIKKLLSHLELENTRLKLLSELEECDPIKILKAQIEHPKTKQEDLRTESKIKKDLTQNAQNLNVLTEFFKDIVQLVPIKNNNIIKNFLEKIQSILDLNSEKNALEAKTNEENPTPQAELITFLQQNESELIEYLKELAEDKQKEITKLQIEKQNLEVLGKKNILNSQISELEEKIQSTKNDQHIYSIIEENNLLKPLIHLERLQKITDNTERDIKELQKQINKKNKYHLDLIEQLKKQKSEQRVAEDYRNQIEKEINIIRDIKTTEWQSKLAQNQRAFRFNSIDTRHLTAEIEKQKINATRKKEWKNIKRILNRTEELLLQSIVETSKNNNTQENIFFDLLKIQLINLKEQVENTVWNKSGWGFFFKKVPDGIQKIRAIFNAKTFDTSESETNLELNKLIMLSIFSEIYLLIKQKNSSNQFFRSPAVKNFYQSVQETLTQVNNQFLALKEPDVEMHNTAQPTYSTSSF
jgi:DNA repair exonuclease SbcCD ATPase subunit